MSKTKKTFNALHEEKEIIPIFFATDDGYAPYLGVALQSLIENASPNFFYKVYVLCVSLSDEHKTILKARI